MNEGNEGFLALEVGSTTTVLSYFNKKGELKQQVQESTTVEDVTRGFEKALKRLETLLAKYNGAFNLNNLPLYVTSSAAGGLKMTVHGLVYDMTVRAAREAALGAGAVIHQVTAGELDDYETQKLKEIEPNIILLAGGVDYGEEKIVIKNAQRIKETGLNTPVIYAGNVACQDKIKDIFSDSKMPLMIVDNVYPSLDELNVEPTRKAVQKVFQDHIIKAGGVESLKEISGQNIMPTPGAVFEGGRILYEDIGDLIIVDVGGATTDVHSFTGGSQFYQDLLISPEPFAKRTVEGDLGVYKNAYNLLNEIESNMKEGDVKRDFEILERWNYIPKSQEEKLLLTTLTSEAFIRALKRHTGRLKYRYEASGRKKFAVGKDLTGVRWIIGTGGALGLQEQGKENIFKVKENFLLYFERENYLMPSKNAGVLLDKNYILAAAGVVGIWKPDLAKRILSIYFDRQLEVKEV